MKKMSLAIIVLVAVSMSCSTKKSENSDVPVVRREINSEVVKTVANLSIEGMTCSSGCGGKIQQELRAMQGVKNTELDYLDNRKENNVSVEFFPSQTNEQQMIQCINSIADGKYRVKSVEIIEYKGLQGTGGHGSDAGIRTDTYLTRAFQLLNLLETLSKMVK